MSRSRRKTPIDGVATGVSEKEFKQRTNGKIRAREQQLLRRLTLFDTSEFEEDVIDETLAKLPNRLCEATNPWDGSKDGKTYFGDQKKKDPKDYSKRMRK